MLVLLVVRLLVVTAVSFPASVPLCDARNRRTMLAAGCGGDCPPPVSCLVTDDRRALAHLATLTTTLSSSESVVVRTVELLSKRSKWPWAENFWDQTLKT